MRIENNRPDMGLKNLFSNAADSFDHVDHLNTRLWRKGSTLGFMSTQPQVETQARMSMIRVTPDQTTITFRTDLGGVTLSSLGAIVPTDEGILPTRAEAIIIACDALVRLTHYTPSVANYMADNQPPIMLLKAAA